MNMLYAISGVVIGIIILTSVFVIKNSFDIANQEKKKMYGMLSSIGATSKQIKKNVLHEGFILGLIGIPLGILGSFAIYKAFANGSDYGYLFPWQAIIIAILVVYILVSLIMHFALRKTRNENIIDAIKDENI